MIIYVDLNVMFHLIWKLCKCPLRRQPLPIFEQKRSRHPFFTNLISFNLVTYSSLKMFLCRSASVRPMFYNQVPIELLAEDTQNGEVYVLITGKFIVAVFFSSTHLNKKKLRVSFRFCRSRFQHLSKSIICLANFFSTAFWETAWPACAFIWMFYLARRDVLKCC